jgi:hypothetical protein
MKSTNPPEKGSITTIVPVLRAAIYRRPRNRPERTVIVFVTIVRDSTLKDGRWFSIYHV